MDLRACVNSGVRLVSPTSGDLESADGSGLGGKLLSLVFGLLAPVLFVPFAYGGGPLLWLAAFVALGFMVGYAMLALSLPEGMIFGSAMMAMSFGTFDSWLGVLAAGGMLVSLIRYGLSDEDAAEPFLDEAPDPLQGL